MLLYTEAQLMDEYEAYIRQLHRTTPNYVNIPTLEEFRVIFEEYYTMLYNGELDGELH
tara:strand:- start:691 stop:864 length:174 start_codon:yes stop_codon:yes gene_type:complete